MMIVEATWWRPFEVVELFGGGQWSSGRDTTTSGFVRVWQR